MQEGMMNDEASLIMRAVVELRQAMGGLNQLDFARALRVSPSTVSRMESLRPAAGSMLAALSRLAESAGRPDLAEVFLAPLHQIVAGASGMSSPSRDSEPIRVANEHERKWVTKVLYVLRSGDPQAFRALTESIEQFERLVNLSNAALAASKRRKA